MKFTNKTTLLLFLFIPLLAKAGDINRDLLRAAMTGDTDAERALLKAGADANAKDKKGFTPLMMAASDGHTDAVRALLEAGADARATSNFGRTALMSAQTGGHTAVVQLLEQHSSARPQEELGEKEDSA